MRTPGESGAQSARLPGGKPLIRLLQLVEAAGYDDIAADAVAAAVPEEDLPAAAAALAPLSTVPSGDPAVQRVLDAGPPVVERTAGAESVAEAHIAAATETPEPVTAAAPGAGAPAPPAQTLWTSLGPTTIPNGQTYGANRVNVSGRVSAVVVDKADASHLIVGAGNGGVWESHNRGASWSPRTDQAATLTVGAIAQDPKTPSALYCGTGEGNWWSWLGAGVLRSGDGGTTWTPLCGAPFIGQGFYDLHVDPADSTRLLAGTTGGLYLSTDGGSTWQQTRPAKTWSLALAPQGAATETFAASADGLFSSGDSGRTWAQVALPGAPAGWNRLAVAIAPSDRNTAYAWGAAGNAAFFYRRSGGTWTAVAAPANVNIGQAWYDWFLAVSPSVATDVYVGAIDVYRGDLSGAAPAWTDISSQNSPTGSIHPDQHAIAFDPGDSSSIYVGNDGGLFHSSDRGATWTHCNNGLVITEFEYMAQDLSSPHWVIAGTQDNGTARWTGSPVWDHVADGDGGHVGVNHGSPNTVFHTYYGMSPEVSTARGDFGSWASINLPIPPGEQAPFYPPLDSGALGGNTVAIAGGALYVSRDNGTNVARLAFPEPGSASAVCVATQDAVYVGTGDGRVLKTTWNGAAWSALVQLAMPRANASVSDLYVEPAAQQRLWATYTTVPGSRVFRSDDGGNTWSDQTGNLPVSLPINAIAVDPSDASHAWVGADVGVYETKNAGGAWQRFGIGLPNAYVGDLAYHPTMRMLRAATRSRGMWEAALPP